MVTDRVSNSWEYMPIRLYIREDGRYLGRPTKSLSSHKRVEQMVKNIISVTSVVESKSDSQFLHELQENPNPSYVRTPKTKKGKKNTIECFSVRPEEARVPPSLFRL